MDKKKAPELIDIMQGVILVYSTIFAIKGLIDYSISFGEWVEKRFGDQERKIRPIR